MPTYVAFLRAVNVGGTGKLPMSTLRDMCAELGFTDVQTYIASGNLVLTSTKAKGAVKKALEDRLRDYMGKNVGVVLRSRAEVNAVLDNNPFPDADPKRTLAILLDGKPAADALDQAAGQADEEMQTGAREIYVHYPSGIGSSKLRIPATREGTTRNMNTIGKMVALAAKTPPRK